MSINTVCICINRVYRVRPESVVIIKRLTFSSHIGITERGIGLLDGFNCLLDCREVATLVELWRCRITLYIYAQAALYHKPRCTRISN